MYLGIEIGGTKLQIGIGDGIHKELIDMVRFDVDPARAAPGILEQIEQGTRALLQKHSATCSDDSQTQAITAIGVGFGGPVDSERGVAVTSHQVAGWNKFPLAQWCRNNFGLPTSVGNDCDCATLAETRLGAGCLIVDGKKDSTNSLFYVTVGTGIGGGCTLGGNLLGSDTQLGIRPAIAEIGHLRPGPQSDKSEMTVESVSSGLGIANSVRSRISGAIAGSTVGSTGVDGVRIVETENEFLRDLLLRCDGDVAKLNGRMVGQAAAEGNEIAQSAIDHGIEVLGWAIAQTITLLAPEMIVVGGGVSLLGEHDFFRPLRKSIDKYVFPILKDSFQVVPAALGEEVVVQGAIILAANQATGST